MKGIAITVLALAVAGTTGLAFAQDYHNDPRNGPSNARSDWAQVVSVERVGGQYPVDPVGYERQQCWNEQTRNYDDGYYRDHDGRLYRGDAHSNTKGAIIGALVGGALGNQVGKGDGRKAATVAGAVIGAGIGANTGNNNNADYNYRDDRGTVRRCRTVFVQTGERGNGGPGGYAVTYRYGGQQYRDFTSVRPGRTVRVRVDVKLQDGGDYHR